jgi:hypothetical protein
LRELEWTLGERPGGALTLKVNPDAPADVVALYNAWLGIAPSPREPEVK